MFSAEHPFVTFCIHLVQMCAIKTNNTTLIKAVFPTTSKEKLLIMFSKINILIYKISEISYISFILISLESCEIIS